MGYFNIKLDDADTLRFKELKTIFKCKNNDEVVKKLIAIAQDYLQLTLFKPNSTKSSKPK